MAQEEVTMQYDENGNRIYPGQVIGYRGDGRPIHLIAGASEDDADDEADDEDDEVDADDESEEDESEGAEADKKKNKPWTPPSKEEWERTQRRLARVNKESAKRRKQLNDSDPDKVKADADSAAEARYKPMVVRSEARAQLKDMGLKGDAKKLLRLIDMNEVDVDEDGEITGLEDQLNELKEDYPDLFTDPKQKNRRIRGDASGKQDAGGKTKSSAEKIAAAFNGK